MKKIFILCLALFSVATTFAQEAKDIFEFTDKDGKTIPSGSVLTVNTVEESDFGDAIISSGVYVKQLIGKDEDTYGTNLSINLTRLDNGHFESCFPGSCKSVKGTGTFNTDPNFMGNSSLQTEWFPEDNGTTTAVITLNAYMAERKGGKIPTFTYTKIGECSTITVNFVNNPTGISSLESESNATVVAYYTVDGKQITAPQKGLNIAKLANGKTVKVIR